MTLLDLREISKSYEGTGGSRTALRGVSLQVDRGQMVGVFGASGCGKTTLLRIAAGLQTPDSGKVLYNGERVDRMPSSERMRLRRREIACVWSEPQQDRLSVLDHVSMPLLIDRRDHRSARRRARQALLACEAEHCIGVELSELSDGERQRVTIARALVIEPKLLLADGAASSLSLPEQEAMMTLLASLARDARVAVLLADSNAEALIRADTIMYLSEGRLIDSTPQQGKVVKLPVRPRQAAADA